MNKIEASKKAIDTKGAAELARQLSEITGEDVTVFAVRKWRQRGVPGEWVPAVCSITGANPRDLNPLVPDESVA